MEDWDAIEALSTQSASEDAATASQRITPLTANVSSATTSASGTRVTPSTGNPPETEIAEEGRGRGRRARAWLYTRHLNHFPEGTAEVRLPDVLPTRATYLVAQLERGEETGRVHVQGYVRFEHPVTMATTVRRLNGASVYPVTFTPNRARNYACKEATRLEGTSPIELGTPPEQGKRSDLHLFRDEAPKKRKRELLEEFPHIIAQYPRFYRDCTESTAPTREEGTLRVHLYIGPTRSGKSYAARHFEGYTPDQIWVAPISSGKTFWFDGYDSHPVAVFDDFEGHMPLKQLLQCLDDYVGKVEVKGGFTWWNPEHIIITCNEPPWTWYDFENRAASRDALFARFHRVREYTGHRMFDSHDTGYLDHEHPCSIPFFPYKHKWNPMRTGMSRKCLDCGQIESF
jgi:hypothetical protein